ncbi:MAG: LptM family lipoprotein [Solirubrobacteraceae bacterium]
MRRLLALIAIAVLAVALSACGNKKDVTLHGATEGTYLDLGPMKYQVQISRLLNPTDREDREYLSGLPAGEKLGPDEQWFAVFIRVDNQSDKVQPAADQYSIKDTQGTVFRPIALPRSNVFAYQPDRVGPHDVLPLPDTAAAQSTIQGSLLLFKIPVKNFENRPLELDIDNSAVPGKTASVDLDV